MSKTIVSFRSRVVTGAHQSKGIFELHDRAEGGSMNGRWHVFGKVS